MSEPLVSVIIGTYNREAFIEETLAGVIAQTFDAYEIIVVDDASTDRTLEILRGYGDRIRLIERKTNSGTADVPRYQAVEAARGSYCALLDSDDLWKPDKLARQIEFMQSHPEIELSHTYMEIIDGEGQLVGIRHENRLPSTGTITEKLLEHCFISTSSVMVKREAWLKAQPFEALNTFGTEWDFFLSIARKGPVGLIPEVLGAYRRSPAGVSQGKWKRFPRDIAAKERIYRKGLWKEVISRGAMIDIIQNACRENADHHRYDGHPSRSLYFCSRGLRYRPFAPALLKSLVKAGVRMVVR